MPFSKKYARFIKTLVFSTALAIATTYTPAFAQSSSNANANASAIVAAGISLAKNTDMNFAQVVRSSTSGTVALTAAATPVRTPSGGVTLGQGGTAAAAQFTATGETGYTFTVTLPASPVTITSGGNTMTVSPFTCSLSGAPPVGTLTGGTNSFYVGATLNVGANQATGTYSGSFSVTVTYQ